jgi:cytochrome c-type biogenesis protein CcmF
VGHALRRIDVHLLWLAPLPVLALCLSGGMLAERTVLALAVIAALAGIALPLWRRLLAGLTAGLLVAAAAGLVLHLLADDFAYRYVWTYSASALPWHLKLANLWGGDEGTLLFMAALAALLGPWLGRGSAWAESGALVIAAAFAAGALIWNPFAPTSAEALAELPSRGMNAHLLSVWMAFHPPQVFGAYVILLLPTGAALEALAGKGGAWGAIAPRAMRLAWLVLSLGLALGMWWAYEDFSFGQVWHWDPVQTSIFIVWALLTAQLHTLRRYRPDGLFAVLGPLLALLAASMALISMAVTRSSTLASSHRYIGDTSGPLLLGFGLALFAATIAAVLYRRDRVARHRQHAHPMLLWLKIGITMLVLAGAVAGGHLAHAYASAFLGIPRPDYFKPYLEFMRQRAGPEEMQALLAAFGQWDVDKDALNRLLAPVGILLGLAGGHAFLLWLPRRRRWALTLGAIALGLAAALWLQPIEAVFEGPGMTGYRIMEILPLLDLLAVAVLFFLAASLASLAMAVIRHRTQRRFARFDLPVTLIHLGVTLSLAAGLLAMTLDTYASQDLVYPGDFGKEIAFPGGYVAIVELAGEERAHDGGRGATADGAFRSVARIDWTLLKDGVPLDRASGHAVYRDDRPPGVRSMGSVRLMCEMVDYRFARFMSGDRQMIHPVIHRGLVRDVQLWFPAVHYQTQLPPNATPAEFAAAREASVAPLMLKIYPLLSWIWIGFLMILAGAAILTLRALLGRHHQA